MDFLSHHLLAEIAHQVGTPCYVYDRARIAKNYARLANALTPAPDVGHICYSVKANSNLSILRLMRDLGTGFDVVSGGELQRALLAGAAPDSIVFAGVGKRDDELVAALDAGIGWINVESAQELRLLSDLATARGVIQRVALRVNPGVDPHTHRYLATGKRASKFGIEIEEALRLVAQRADCPGLAIEGIHIHIGSMVSDVAPYLDAMRVALEVIAQCRALGATITTLNLGGGFGVAYQPEQAGAPIEAIADAILPPARRAGLRLLFEPGRAIVADAGVLLTRVLYTKTNGGMRYVVVDAAMNDLIRPALYGAGHRVSVVSGASEVSGVSEVSEVSVVGPVCESGDVLAEGVMLPELRRGDLLVIYHAGAYGMSMASNYNTRPRAAEVLVADNQWKVIRRREIMADLWAQEVECLA
ncbi:MAG: diaminopimelate decarboxylase [Anaerolineae bacterium]|nr:diaminopimelate decarboxylase [Candidatus Roseilinea sp.]MDW8448708.1 diaminopimelate decarboxylase [Anaerolineae bacterium]